MTSAYSCLCRRRHNHDLRHSFVSLLLAAGHQPVWVARQAGYSLGVLLRTYAHLIDEYAESPAIDPEAEIATARQDRVPPEFHKSA